MRALIATLSNWRSVRKSAAMRLITFGLVDQGIVSVVNFLTIVLLARTLPPAPFGLFMIAQTALTLLTGLQNSLVTQPHNVLGAQREGDAYKQLTAMLALLQIALSLAFAALAAIAGAAWLFHGENEYARVAFALAMTIPSWMGQEFFRRIFYTKGDIRGAALNNLLTYGLQLTGICIIAFKPHFIPVDPVNALLVLGAASLIACLWAAYQLHGRVGLIRFEAMGLTSWRGGLESFRETWRLSKWLVAQQAVAWFGTSGHGLLLAALLGPATFGSYRAAYQIVNVLNPLRQAAANHLPSTAARIAQARDRKELVRWNWRVTALLGIPFLLCALLVVAFAAPLAKLMYGTDSHLPHFELIVAVGALSYVINFARTPSDYTILAADGARTIFLRTLGLNAFVLTVGIALISQLGVVGVMFSELTTAVLAALVTVTVLISITRKPRDSIVASSLAARSPCT